MLRKCARECLFSSLKILSLVDEIKHQSVWWRNGFIGGTLGTLVPHVDQLVYKRLVIIVDIWVDEANNFTFVGRDLTLLWILRCGIKYLGIFDCQFGAMVG